MLCAASLALRLLLLLRMLIDDVAANGHAPAPAAAAAVNSKSSIGL